MLDKCVYCWLRTSPHPVASFIAKTPKTRRRRPFELGTDRQVATSISTPRLPSREPHRQAEVKTVGLGCFVSSNSRQCHSMILSRDQDITKSMVHGGFAWLERAYRRHLLNTPYPTKPSVPVLQCFDAVGQPSQYSVSSQPHCNKKPWSELGAFWWR